MVAGPLITLTEWIGNQAKWRYSLTCILSLNQISLTVTEKWTWTKRLTNAAADEWVMTIIAPLFSSKSETKNETMFFLEICILIFFSFSTIQLPVVSYLILKGVISIFIMLSFYLIVTCKPISKERLEIGFSKFTWMLIFIRKSPLLMLRSPDQKLRLLWP